ncbi:MAG TPA: sigma-70 family RNA polymerase sigma factor, partial [Tepidisphaeraceae bacterium]|nr:sigma-70 family RNA polymerase sigma factor [Tepidisphaeraceae bacterium]
AETARDVVQQALTALLTLGQAPDNPVAWMYRAVRNAAIDQVRSGKGRRRREGMAARQRGAWFEESADTAIDAQAAQQMLEGMSAQQREIVVLRIWGELGFAEIGEIAGMSVSAVHKNYTAALEELRLKLEKPCRK